MLQAERMKVTLKRYYAQQDDVCGEAAAICYDGRNPARSLRQAMAGGHLSVVEHSSFTFEVEGVSRVLLAQLTRHRIASFSVQSQRYCGVQPEWAIPQTIADAGYRGEYVRMCDACYGLLCEMVDDGVPIEDARYVIPQGVTCRLMMTMNARELLHFFELRCCNRAQWEIRKMAWKMLELAKIVAPEIFANAGPACLRGACPEGARSCGSPYGKEESDHADGRAEG